MLNWLFKNSRAVSNKLIVLEEDKFLGLETEADVKDKVKIPNKWWFMELFRQTVLRKHG